METKTTTQFDILDTEMLASIEGGTDWGIVGKGAVYGAGIGVALCGVGGLLTGGSTWAMTAACAWAGAKLGGSFTAIADNLWP
ncbi:Blp family class II bacteriocin [Streptococcus mitis]|uniref:Blp family class II bacteriocin n=1 Tax=Streptococcus mitis TaxID=28037 RepID=UPI0021B4E65C|nr:Blp family class II bacteriocin [Streptococcus mitis]